WRWPSSASLARSRLFESFPTLATTPFPVASLRVPARLLVAADLLGDRRDCFLRDGFRAALLTQLRNELLLRELGRLAREIGTCRADRAGEKRRKRLLRHRPDEAVLFTAGTRLGGAVGHQSPSSEPSSFIREAICLAAAAAA